MIAIVVFVFQHNILNKLCFIVRMLQNVYNDLACY
jgi:hypothetical protein